jgi:hypothetical protein
MPRKKQARVYVPGSDEISRKALKDHEFAVWGPEPVWTADYTALTKNEWDSLDKSERERRWPRYSQFANHEWFQLKAPEREQIVDWEVMCAIGAALNWYNAMVDDAKQKKYLIEYAEEHFPHLVDALKRGNEHSFHAYGAFARCIMRGAKAPKANLEKLRVKIEAIAASVDTVTQSVISSGPTAPKVVERDPRLAQLIGVVDANLDDFGFSSKKSFPEESMADALLKAGATNGQRQKVHEHFSRRILEYFQALNGVKEIVEYYGGVPKKQLKKVYDWLTGKPSEDLVKAVRKTRKPRKTKAKSPATILKRFSFKASDDKLKIQSIDPEDILGAEQLWVFNTKTRKLGVFRAKDEKGLGVSRKSIDNYDEETSICKKIRKPETVVPGVKTAGKVALRHLLEEIRAVESPMRSRISDDVLLVRVVK